MEKIIELTKKAIKNEEAIEELKEALEKELTETGKLSKLCELIKDNELDMEKYSFMMKLIEKDKELYEQIDKLKELKDLKQKQTDLETLKKNISETKEEIIRQIDNLENSTTGKLNIPILNVLTKKILEKKNRDILRTKFEQIIKTIEESKIKNENKNLKEEHFKEVNMKDSLDRLYKYCELENKEEVNKIRNEIYEKYQTILEDIEISIYRCILKYKTDKKETETYDKRLKDYVYNKKNNYITSAIEKLSKKDYIRYDEKNNKIDIKEPDENYELLVYSLIALYIVKKPKNQKIKLNYISNNIKKPSLTKNSIVGKTKKQDVSIKKYKKNK